MAGLGAGAEPRLLGLDEVADPRVFPELRTRAQARERSDRRPPVDTRAVDHRVGFHRHAVREHRVANHAVGPDAHIRTQFHGPFQHHAHVDDTVQAGAQRPAQVEPRRIAERHPGPHRGFRIATLVAPLRAGKLDAVVHTEHLVRIGRLQAGHGNPRRHGPSDNVREVVLALRVVVVDGAEQLAEQGAGRGENAGVDLRDRALPVRGVPVLDDRRDLAFGVTYDPAEPFRSRCLRGDEGHPRALLTRSHAGLERRARDQGHIGVEHEHRGLVRHVRQRLQHRMAGAQLLGLVHPGDVRRIRVPLPDLRRPGPHHDMQLRRGERPCRVQHVAQHGPPANLMKHLRPVRPHASALARGQDDDFERHRGIRTAKVRIIGSPADKTPQLLSRGVA